CIVYTMQHKAFGAFFVPEQASHCVYLEPSAVRRPFIFSVGCKGPSVCIQRMTAFLCGSLPCPTPRYCAISTITQTIRWTRSKPPLPSLRGAECMYPMTHWRQ